MTLKAYRYCSCEFPHTEGCESCDSVVVFGLTWQQAATMLPKDEYYSDRYSFARDPQADCLLPLWEGLPLYPSGKHAKLWRQAGWSDPDSRCAECGLGEWDEVPESVLCPGCVFCGDCGGGRACRECSPHA